MLNRRVTDDSGRAGCGKLQKRPMAGHGHCAGGLLLWALTLGWLGTGVAFGLNEVDELRVGFGTADVTPTISEERPVFLAGYGPGRSATGVHDPLMARSVVLHAGDVRMALVSVDSIGLQYPTVEKIRAALPQYRYVLVTSTHDHEAPDVIGLWGPTPFQSGVDPQYLELVVERCVQSVRQAETRLQPARGEFGTAEDESLVNDSRQPIVKDGVLRVVRFLRAADGAPLGLLVQWNCHPEALGRRNRLITADFPWATIAYLEKSEKCPVVYMSGALGGLMAPPHGVVFDSEGKLLEEGTFSYAERYGQLVGQLAQKALAAARPVRLTPLGVSALKIQVPVRNPWYRVARAAGIVQRESRLWTGDPLTPGEPLSWRNATKTMAVTSEVGVMVWGELRIACIPGEIYPELVYGRYQEPVDPGADFRDAPLEPSVVDLLGQGPWMLAGLANDELGYIIPKRQWDMEPPFCYGRTGPQYGEINSCGPDVAFLVMDCLRRCVETLGQSDRQPREPVASP